MSNLISYAKFSVIRRWDNLFRLCYALISLFEERYLINMRMNAKIIGREIRLQAAPFLVAIFIFSGAIMFSQDMTPKGLKQRIETTVFPQSKTIRTEISRFDRSGRIKETEFLVSTDSESLADKAKSKFIYGQDGSLCEIVQYDGAGAARGKEVIRCDGAGRKIESNSYDSSGDEYYRTPSRTIKAAS